MRRTLEDVLLDAALVDEARLRQVRHYARQQGVCLARAAVEHGGVPEEALAAALAAQLGLPRVDLAREPVDDDAVREVPFDVADGRRLLPLTIERGERRLRVAMADPLDFDASEELELSTGCTLEPLVARVSEIGDAVMRYYRGVITKMIPRRSPGAAAAPPSPPTWPQLILADQAPTDVGLRALLELLVERGLVDRDSWSDRVRQLLQEPPASD